MGRWRRWGPDPTLEKVAEQATGKIRPIRFWVSAPSVRRETIQDPGIEENRSEDGSIFAFAIALRDENAHAVASPARRDPMH